MFVNYILVHLLTRRSVRDFFLNNRGKIVFAIPLDGYLTQFAYNMRKYL